MVRLRLLIREIYTKMLQKSRYIFETVGVFTDKFQLTVQNCKEKKSTLKFEFVIVMTSSSHKVTFWQIFWHCTLSCHCILSQLCGKIKFIKVTKSTSFKWFALSLDV